MVNSGEEDCQRVAAGRQLLPLLSLLWSGGSSRPCVLPPVASVLVASALCMAGRAQGLAERDGGVPARAPPSGRRRQPGRAQQAGWQPDVALGPCLNACRRTYSTHALRSSLIRFFLMLAAAAAAPPLAASRMAFTAAAIWLAPSLPQVECVPHTPRWTHLTVVKVAVGLCLRMMDASAWLNGCSLLFACHQRLGWGITFAVAPGLGVSESGLTACTQRYQHACMRMQCSPHACNAVLCHHCRPVGFSVGAPRAPARCALPLLQVSGRDDACMHACFTRL